MILLFVRRIHPRDLNAELGRSFRGARRDCAVRFEFGQSDTEVFTCKLQRVAVAVGVFEQTFDRLLVRFGCRVGHTVQRVDHVVRGEVVNRGDAAARSCEGDSVDGQAQRLDEVLVAEQRVDGPVIGLRRLLDDALFAEQILPSGLVASIDVQLEVGGTGGGSGARIVTILVEVVLRDGRAVKVTCEELVEARRGVFRRSGEDLDVDARDRVLRIGEDVVRVLRVDDLLIGIVSLNIVRADGQRVVNRGRGRRLVEAEVVGNRYEVNKLLRNRHIQRGRNVVHAVELRLLFGEGHLEVGLAALFVGLDADVRPELIAVARFGAGIVCLCTCDCAGLGVGKLGAAVQLVRLREQKLECKLVVFERNGSVVERLSVRHLGSGLVLQTVRTGANFEAPGGCCAVAVVIVDRNGLFLREFGDPVVAVLGLVHEVGEEGRCLIAVEITDLRTLVVQIVERAGIACLIGVVVSLPCIVGLVIEVSGDVALGEKTEAVTDDVVLGAERDARVIHDIAAVLKQGDTGDARGDRKALEDTEDVRSLGIGELLVGLDALRQRDRVKDRLERIRICRADFCDRTGLFKRFGACRHRCVNCRDIVAELINDRFIQEVEVVLDVRLIVVSVDIDAIPIRQDDGFRGYFGRNFRLLRCLCGLRSVLRGLVGRRGAASNQRKNHDQCQQSGKDLLHVLH